MRAASNLRWTDQFHLRPASELRASRLPQIPYSRSQRPLRAEGSSRARATFSGQQLVQRQRVTSELQLPDVAVDGGLNQPQHVKLVGHELRIGEEFSREIAVASDMSSATQRTFSRPGM
jgi:hypothetical protein